MTEEVSTTQPASEGAERTKLLNAAYASANKRLREAHLDEFRQYQTEEAKKVGIDYTPKPTKEERAEQELAALLSENPTLRARLVEEIQGAAQPTAE